MSPQRLEEIYRKVWAETYQYKNIIERVWHAPNKSLIEKTVLLGSNIGFKYVGI